MLTSEVLRRAKEIIGAPEVWWNDPNPKARRPEGKYCVVLAMDYAAHSRKEADDALAAFRDVAGTSGVVAWNGKRGRTHGDVMLAFAKVIEIAEAREEAENAPAERVESPAMEEVK